MNATGMPRAADKTVRVLRRCAFGAAGRVAGPVRAPFSFAHDRRGTATARECIGDRRNMSEMYLRQDLLRRGVSDVEIRRTLRAGRLRALRPGCYLGSADPLWRDTEARHTALTEATFARLAPDAVLSHVSAAVRHGLPVWGVSLTTVRITRDRVSGGRATSRLRLYVAPLAPDETVLVDGLPTTSVVRTVIDVGRTAPFETAVAVADAALHLKMATAGELETALSAASGRRGIGRARAVLAFADGLADGPGESRSRVRMDRAGVVPPELQHPFHDARGRHVGTVDFWWRDAGVIGEFDGEEKYSRYLRPGETIGDAVMREKKREDALRSLPDVRTVARWTWDELREFSVVAARLPRRPGR